MAIPFRTHIPFVEHLGFELQRFHGGEAEITVAAREEFTNSWGVAHGGLIMTLLDVVMAHAARSPDAPDGEPQPGVVTIEMKTTFMRPGLGALRAHGQLMHRTASLAFCEGRVYAEDGTLAAHATVTFKYMRGLPVGGGGRRIQKLSASD